MNKLKVTPVILIFLGSFTLVRPIFSQDIENRWGLGYRYGYVDADDANYKTHGNAHNLNLTYIFNENFATELESGYFRLKSKNGSALGVFSFYANLQLRTAIKSFYPYIVGGIGGQYYDYDKLKGNDRKDKTVSFSYKTGLGVEYFFDKNWALNFECVYVYGNTGGNATLDVYGWHYCAGMKYYF